MPSAMRRSANSETMIASSTSIPTARISENSTTMLTDSPASCSPSTPARQDAGRDRVLQVAEHLPDDLRFVLGEGDVHGFGPGLLQRRHCRLHRVDRLDEVGAGALGDL